MHKIISRSEARALVLPRYFTGEACVNKHISERRTSDGQCVECAREKLKRWKTKHPGHWAELARKYRDANPERYREIKARSRERHADKIREKLAKWRLQNKDHLKKYAAAHRQRATDGARRRRAADPEKYRQKGRDEYKKNRKNRCETARKWYQNNREKALAAGKRWRMENADVLRILWRRRRARKRNAAGRHTKEDVRAIIILQKNKCAYCCASLSSKNTHIDHIIPLARGGGNDRSNLQALCAACNQKKWAKMPEDFARQMGKLI